jgi:hypothetical protein
MNTNGRKKAKTAPKQMFTAFLSGTSRIVIDPKSELAAVARGKSKNGATLTTLNPFLVLPTDQLEAMKKWFPLCVATAMDEVTKGQRKEANEHQRKSQRAH